MYILLMTILYWIVDTADKVYEVPTRLFERGRRYWYHHDIWSCIKRFLCIAAVALSVFLLFLPGLLYRWIKWDWDVVLTCERLRTFYPDILKGCWEVGVGRGWLPMVRDLLELMKIEGRKYGVAYHVVQIKEKFGGLRYYYDSCYDDALPPSEEVEFSRERVSAAVSEAENRSVHICEACGEPGELNTTGWWTTLCPRHNRSH